MPPPLKIFLLLISISLFGPSAFGQGKNERGILGTYPSGIPGLSSQTLTLSEDGSFVMDFWGEGSFTIAFLEGAWKKKGRFIYLSYFPKPKIEPESFQVREDSTNIKNQITVTDNRGTIPGVTVICISNGNKVTGTTDLEGNFYFPNMQLDSIILMPIGHEVINYKVKNPSKNYFEFNLRDSRKYFTAYLQKNPLDQSDTLRIVKHKLIGYKNTTDLKQKVGWEFFIKARKGKNQK